MSCDSYYSYSGDQSSMRRKSSFVWRYFEKLNRQRVRCNLCQHEQNYQGTTGNILRHLKVHHKIFNTSLHTNLSHRQPDIKTTKVVNELQDDDEENEFTSIKSEQNQMQITVLPRNHKQIGDHIESYCEDDDTDPYTEATNMNSYFEPTNTNATKDDARKINEGGSNNKRTNNLDEERITAEIEYFREKAAYYRIQKNLVALQAKKMKYELEQLGL